MSQYSTLMLMPREWKRLTLSTGECLRIRSKHHFVLVGGPHRGGTTLLWRLLAHHQEVSAFAEGVDSDFSEGSFLQTVLPTFGVGMERPGPGMQKVGLGRYALSAQSHMTEAHPLNTDASSCRLISEWGFYWNLTKPVLLEKTPTNMVTSRLLQALLAPTASFLFITRHPLAVSLAHQRWPCCKSMTIPSLILHWLASHQWLLADMRHLRHTRVLVYEDLAMRPREVLADVLSWLRLPPLAINARAHVRPHSNAKYERAYCELHLSSPQAMHGHCAMAQALQPAIEQLGFGYDVRYGGRLGFACIRAALRGMNETCDTVQASTEVEKAILALPSPAVPA